MDNVVVALSEAEIEEGLVALRKGRALTDATLRERISPALLATAGVPHGIPQGQVRARLTHRLRTAAEQLPPDLRAAAEAMFGLTAEYWQPLLGARQRLLAERSECDPRTVRRRCDEALQLLAEILAMDDRTNSGTPAAPADEATPVPGAWYNRELRLLVRLDLSPAEVREERCVVAIAAGLSEVTASTGVLAFDPAESACRVRNEIDYGGALYHTEDLRGGLSLAQVRLPVALAPGEDYWYGRTVRAVSSRDPAPRALYTPSVRCDRLTLRIRFAGHSVPPVVRRVEEVRPELSGFVAETAPSVHVNAVNEVQAVFEQLVLGRTYGLVWER
jgi:hypothetical protein